MPYKFLYVLGTPTFLLLSPFVWRLVQQTSRCVQSAAGTRSDTIGDTRSHHIPRNTPFNNPRTGHKTTRARGRSLFDQAGNDSH